MDKKFRISFYPKDASRVKVVTFSRQFLIFTVCISFLLSSIGVSLVLLGNLHEAPETRQLRKQLELENQALEQRVGQLDQDLHGLRGDLSHLEEQKVNALMLSGVQYLEEGKQRKGANLFSFFHSLAPMKTDVGASLLKAQRISTYFDSTLKLLEGQGRLVDGLPTGYPVAAEALVTREFGYSPDPFTGRKALHAGVDFSLRAGAPIFASGGGVVEEVGKDLLWGNCIKINHGRGVVSFYAHLQDMLVHPGQKVMRGETIATMGMTGVATGVHLHYELTVHNVKADPIGYFLPELTLSRSRDSERKGPGG